MVASTLDDTIGEQSATSPLRVSWQALWALFQEANTNCPGLAAAEPMTSPAREDSMVTAAQIHLSPSGFDEIVTGLLARAQHSAYTAVPDWRLRGPPCRARPVRRSSAGTLTISLDYDPKLDQYTCRTGRSRVSCTHVRHQSLTRQDLSNGFLEARCSVEQQAAD